jgi:hypothetical protein
MTFYVLFFLVSQPAGSGHREHWAADNNILPVLQFLNVFGLGHRIKLCFMLALNSKDLKDGTMSGEGNRSPHDFV